MKHLDWYKQTWAAQANNVNMETGNSLFAHGFQTNSLVQLISQPIFYQQEFWDGIWAFVWNPLTTRVTRQMSLLICDF